MASVASLTLKSMASARSSGSGSAAAPDDAVADVLLHQPEADGVQGLGDGGDLGEDVDAVLVLIDHPGDAADLALDPFEPQEVGVLVGGVAVLLVRCWRPAAP